MKLMNLIFICSFGCYNPLLYAQDKQQQPSAAEVFDVVESKPDQIHDFSGHRIGLGIANAGYLDKNIYVVEYGYEFNRYVGFMISASNYQNSDNFDIGDEDLSIHIDGVYTRVAVDLGYTFVTGEIDLKPYLITGFINVNESNSLASESQMLFQYGVGLRITVDKGIFLDASYRNSDVKNWLDESQSRDGNETLLTIGYKF